MNRPFEQENQITSPRSRSELIQELQALIAELETGSENLTELLAPEAEKIEAIFKDHLQKLALSKEMPLDIIMNVSAALQNAEKKKDYTNLASEGLKENYGPIIAEQIRTAVLLPRHEAKLALAQNFIAFLNTDRSAVFAGEEQEEQTIIAAIETRIADQAVLRSLSEQEAGILNSLNQINSVLKENANNVEILAAEKAVIIETINDYRRKILALEMGLNQMEKNLGQIKEKEGNLLQEEREIGRERKPLQNNLNAIQTQISAEEAAIAAAQEELIKHQQVLAAGKRTANDLEGQIIIFMSDIREQIRGKANSGNDDRVSNTGETAPNAELTQIPPAPMATEPAQNSPAPMATEATHNPPEPITVTESLTPLSTETKEVPHSPNKNRPDNKEETNKDPKVKEDPLTLIEAKLKKTKSTATPEELMEAIIHLEANETLQDSLLELITPEREEYRLAEILLDFYRQIGIFRQERTLSEDQTREIELCAFHLSSEAATNRRGLKFFVEELQKTAAYKRRPRQGEENRFREFFQTWIKELNISYSDNYREGQEALQGKRVIFFSGRSGAFTGQYEGYFKNLGLEYNSTDRPTGIPAHIYDFVIIASQSLGGRAIDEAKRFAKNNNLPVFSIPHNLNNETIIGDQLIKAFSNREAEDQKDPT